MARFSMSGFRQMAIMPITGNNALAIAESHLSNTSETALCYVLDFIRQHLSQ